MRLSVFLLFLALAGMVGGAWLAGGWTGVGAAVMFDSLATGGWALWRDDGREIPPQVAGVPTLEQILEREAARP